jgi:ADP-ribosylglycohydrolase
VTPRDRALGALYGLAIGDALGMPTQLMSRSAVSAAYGSVTGFLDAAPDHPLAAGMAAGSVTDDTEQALLLSRLLISGHGHVDSGIFADTLVAWENRMRARGSLDLLGPSTKRAVQAVLDGEPVETAGRYGTTNGAAMRVTPIGIVMPSDDLDALVDRVVEASRVSHNTGVAIAGAAAVAAAVSAGIDGKPYLPAALAAARIGAERGFWIAAADVASRIHLATTLASPLDPAASLTATYEVIGTSLATQESVPAAFGILAIFPDDPWKAVCAAASLGGDSDTVAAMVGAIAGAVHGVDSWPSDARATVRDVNALDLEAVVDGLLALR